MRTGHESGFSVYYDFEDRRRIFTPVFEGNTESLPVEPFWNWRLRNEPHWPHRTGDFFLEFHFHPDYGGPPGISESDLGNLDSHAPGYSFRPIQGIGQVDDEGSGYIVCLQKTFEGELMRGSYHEIEHFLDRYWNAAWSWNTPQHRECLDLPGYIQGEVLRFDLPAASRRAIIHNSDVVNRFAYTIHSEVCGVDELMEFNHRDD